MPPRPTRLGLLATFLVAISARGDDLASLREGFESPRTSWRQEETDATIELLAHDRSDRAAHQGTRSERFQFQAQAGSAFYYSYRLPRVPLARDLRVSLFCRSNQAGVQLLGRVVLPADTDPDTGQPSFVTVQGTVSNQPDRWQRLELTDLTAAVERQARVLRSGSNRPVSLDGAYLERLVVNLYGGPGAAEVFLDDLTVSPVPEAVVAEAAGAPPLPEPAPDGGQPAPAAAAAIRLDGNRLIKEGRDWVPMIVHAPGADLDLLRQHGADVLALDANADPALARQAARQGFRLMPLLGDQGEPDATVGRAGSFAEREAVAFWYLGDRLGDLRDKDPRKAQLRRTRDVLKGLRSTPDGLAPLATAGVAGQYPQYTQPGQGLDLIGIDPAPWGTVQDPRETYYYLTQRRDLSALSNPLGLHWAWLPTAAPAAFQQAVWGTDVPPPWGLPRVQPEQVRLFAYAALMAGYRGLGFRADADLTHPAGRAMLLELALLRDELNLIEPIVAQGADPIPLLKTFPPDKEVKIEYNPLGIAGGLAPRQQTKEEPETPPHPSIVAARIATKDGRGRLLLIADFAPGAQCQPPQMAITNLKLLTQAPDSATAWEITPGEVRNLTNERVPGGRRITLPEFGGTALVLVTTDLDSVRRLEAQVRSRRSQSIARAIEQAELQYAWVVETQEGLAGSGHDLRNTPESIADPAGLLGLARANIESARQALAREDYATAWDEARRAGRPLRHLMRLHWDQARGDLDDATRAALAEPDRRNERSPGRRPPLLETPVASPTLAAFNLLPRHYDWVEWASGRNGSFGANLVEGGAFDEAETLSSARWTTSGHAFDRISSSVRVRPKAGWDGGGALVLDVRPETRDQNALAPYLDQPAAAVRTPPVHLDKAGQFVRIRVLVKLPRRTPPGAGGLIVRDSIGGEALQFRTTEAVRDWKEVVLYRRSPGPCDLTITLGLAGFGEAFFDDLRVERVEAPAPVASQPPSDRRRASR